MVVVNYSDFRKNLKENLDHASEDKEIIIVSRAHNKNVVVISLDEYNSWQETKYLMSSDNNRQRLLDAIKDTEQGNYETHNLVEE
jgi:antitoxin YefM